MSGIDTAKSVMGYVRATQRAGCKNCVHAEARDCIHPTWWCQKGGFLTSPMAICGQHAPRDGAHKDAA